MNAKTAIVLICLSAVSGCAGLRESGPSGEMFRRNAVAFETQDELPQALAAWRAAAMMDPDDPMLPQHLQSLEKTLSEASHAHYRTGLERHQAGDIAQARREMLTAVRLSPAHARALHHLKTHLSGTDLQLYKVQRGDSFIKIASDRYKDPSKAFAIAYFNDMDPGKPLLIDTVLILPAFTPEQLIPRRQVDGWVEKAQKALEEKQFSDVIAICEKIGRESPGHPRIQPLINAARLSWGLSLIEKKDYLGALQQLKQIGSEVPGRDQAIRSAQNAIQRKAVQDKVRSAQDHLDRGTYGEAIAVCLDILNQESSHAKANELLQASRYKLGKQLLDQGNDKEAYEILGALDREYLDAAHLLARARARLNMRAEAFYRNGVKFFLNEDLESAIESWKKALTFNPNHPKARLDMDNALRLLEKWRNLEHGAPTGK